MEKVLAKKRKTTVSEEPEQDWPEGKPWESKSLKSKPKEDLGSETNPASGSLMDLWSRAGGKVPDWFRREKAKRLRKQRVAEQVKALED